MRRMKKVQKQAKCLKLKGRAEVVGTDLIIKEGKQGKNGRCVKRSLVAEAKDRGLLGKTVRYRKKSDAGGMSIAGLLHQNEEGKLCVGAHVLEHYLKTDFTCKHDLEIAINEEFVAVPGLASLDHAY